MFPLNSCYLKKFGGEMFLTLNFYSIGQNTCYSHISQCLLHIHIVNFLCMCFSVSKDGFKPFKQE